MSGSPRRVAASVVCLLLTSSAADPAGAGPAADGTSRHHVSLLASAAWFLEDPRPTYWYAWEVGEQVVRGPAPPRGGDLGPRYRYAPEPGKELVLDVHRTRVDGDTRVVPYTGPPFERHWIVEVRSATFAVRTSNLWGRVRPYGQFGLTYVRSYSGNDDYMEYEGWALGPAAALGAEIGVASTLSIPIEVGLQAVLDAGDRSTLGIRTGLTWHGGESRTALVDARRSAELATLAEVTAPRPPGHPHHVTILGGYARHLRSVPSGSTSIAVAPDGADGGADLRDASDFGFRYRYEFESGSEVVLEVHRVLATGTTSYMSIDGAIEIEEEYEVNWYGVGFRNAPIEGHLRPFFGASMLYADLPGSDATIGFAAASGVDVGVASALSVPIEIGYLVAPSSRGLSTLSIRTGISLDFGGGRPRPD